jgi:hypothetical protein
MDTAHDALSPKGVASAPTRLSSNEVGRIRKIFKVVAGLQFCFQGIPEPEWRSKPRKKVRVANRWASRCAKRWAIYWGK